MLRSWRPRRTRGHEREDGEGNKDVSAYGGKGRNEYIMEHGCICKEEMSTVACVFGDTTNVDLTLAAITRRRQFAFR